MLKFTIQGIVEVAATVTKLLRHAPAASFSALATASSIGPTM